MDSFKQDRARRRRRVAASGCDQSRNQPSHCQHHWSGCRQMSKTIVIFGAVGRALVGAGRCRLDSADFLACGRARSYRCEVSRTPPARALQHVVEPAKCAQLGDRFIRSDLADRRSSPRVVYAARPFSARRGRPVAIRATSASERLVSMWSTDRLVGSKVVQAGGQTLAAALSSRSE